MMSLSKFRENLFDTFKLMRDTGVVIDVYHRRTVYKLHIEPTTEKVTKPYKPRVKKIVPNDMISSQDCPQCNSLIINGVCMNRSCPSNQKAPAGPID